jgi:hypothetical protein
MLHTIKLFWATMGITEKQRNFMEGVRDDMGDMGRYLDIMLGSRDIKEYMEKYWAVTRELRLIRCTGCWSGITKGNPCAADAFQRYAKTLSRFFFTNSEHLSDSKCKGLQIK